MTLKPQLNSYVTLLYIYIPGTFEYFKSSKGIHNFSVNRHKTISESH